MELVSVAPLLTSVTGNVRKVQSRQGTLRSSLEQATRFLTGSACGLLQDSLVFYGTLCLKMREPSLNETDAPPRRRSLTLATPQKSFLCISDFARAGFFLLKGKQNFFVVFCSERAGGGAFRTSLGRLGIPPPNPLLPSRPRTRGQVFCLRGG